MDFLPLLASFGLILVAELGDKTQLAVISLSSKRKSKSVFVGALLAFAVVDGISALAGGAVAALIPAFWIGLGAGALSSSSLSIRCFLRNLRNVRLKPNP